MEQKLKPKKVTVNILGIAKAKQAMGGSKVEIEVNGETYGELLDEIERKYGYEVRKSLGVQVMRNGEIIKNDDLLQRLEDGDRYSFISMIAGG